MVNIRFNQNQRSQVRFYNPRNQYNGEIVKLGQKNRLKVRKFNKKPNLKKFKRVRCNFDAPLNTTSYIIRLRNKNGGLKKPLFAYWSGDVIDIDKEQWGVYGYGSMNGLIRVRDDVVCEDECDSSVSDVGEHVDVEKRLGSCLSRFEMVLPENLDDNPIAMFGSDGGNGNVVCEGECESSVSDVDEHVEVERRLDIGLSRFEMVLPKNLGGGGVGGDQSGRIAKLKEKNVVIKKRVVVIENEIDEFKRRLLCIERKNQGGRVVDMKLD